MLSLIILALSAHRALTVAIPALPLPDYIERACHRTDPNLNACIVEVGSKALQKVIHGDEKYRIPSLSPFVIPEVRISPQGTQQVGLTAVCTNCTMTGLEKTVFTKSETDLEGRRAKWTFYVEDLDVTGLYNASGKILLMPILGNGTAHIHTKNSNFESTFSWILVKKDNNLEYVKVTDLKTEYDIGGLSVNLEGLFNGDKLMGDTMNKFMNENWKAVVDELGPPIAEAMAKVFADTINAMGDLVPYKYLFPE